jgi:hypothetical protein
LGHVHASTDTDYKVHTTTHNCSISSSRMRLTRASWLVHVPLRIPEASVPATRPARATHGRVVYSIPRILAILEPRPWLAPSNSPALLLAHGESQESFQHTKKARDRGLRKAFNGWIVCLVVLCPRTTCLDLANLGSCHRQLPAAFTGSCSHNSGVTESDLRISIYKALPLPLSSPLFFFFCSRLCSPRFMVKVLYTKHQE